MTYGSRLRLARIHLGLTQEELAKLTNEKVKQGSISKIERDGQGYSSFDVELGLALNVHPKWLQDGDSKFEPEWLTKIEDNNKPEYKVNPKNEQHEYAKQLIEQPKNPAIVTSTNNLNKEIEVTPELVARYNRINNPSILLALGELFKAGREDVVKVMKDAVNILERGIAYEEAERDSAIKQAKLGEKDKA